jgi:hypothetical protein
MAAAVTVLDVDLLASADEVRAIAECAPTPQEAVLLAAYARNEPSLATLSDAELFCYQLMKVRWGQIRRIQKEDRMNRQEMCSTGEAQTCCYTSSVQVCHSVIQSAAPTDAAEFLLCNGFQANGCGHLLHSGTAHCGAAAGVHGALPVKTSAGRCRRNLARSPEGMRTCIMQAEGFYSGCRLQTP